MKKLGIILLCFLFLITTFYAVVQSNIGRNFIRDSLKNGLQDSGFAVEIGLVEGTLPNQIYLKNISVKGEGLDLTIEEVSLRPNLWRFLKGEIAFKDIHAKEAAFSKGAPFDFDGNFWMNSEKLFINGKILDWQIKGKLDRHSKLLVFNAKNPLINVKGNAPLDENYHLIAANIQLTSDDLISKRFPSASGRILSTIAISKEEGVYKESIRWQIHELFVDKVKIGSIKGDGRGVFENSTFLGEISSGPYVKANFDWQIKPNFLIVGTNQIEVDNLHALHLPHTYGKMEAQLLWEINNGVQALHCDATVENLYYKELFAQKATLYSDLKDPLGNMTGLVDISLEKAKWNELRLETANFETTIGTKSGLFEFAADGEWKHPIELQMDGRWDDNIVVDVENFKGTFFNHPFVLEKAVKMKWTNTHFDLSDVQIAINGASIFADVHRSEDNTDAVVRFDQLPLDFLSLNPLDVQIIGKVDLNLEIHEVNSKLKGSLSTKIMQTAPFNAVGAFDGNFDRDLLQVKGNLDVREQPLARVDASLPIHFSIWPFKAELLHYREAKGTVAFDGPVEEFLDFFDLGPHRLEGKCRGELSLKNTLYRPIVEGTCIFENGSYENYYTGTKLKNIQADWLAEKNVASLRSLTALDEPGDGAIAAQGEIRLLQGDLYPFRFDVQLQDFQFTGVDLVKASADGSIQIEGNITSALAKGEIQITESVLTVPDHIRRPLPELEVVYINPDHPVPPSIPSEYTPYPIHLDLHVLAPKVIISGRGLDSQWKGDFHLGGTLTDIATHGKLELLEGEFNFSSKSFNLTNGSLSFSGIEHQMPQIDLSGVVETKGIAITVQLHGPLDNPQITLHSSPPLPISSIMSHLLFGQDLSEISGFQALELASSLASIAGTGPDIMESTRRSLGVDRLRIITDPDAENGETIALQVGKYVSKGVLVTLTQGVEESSTNIKIEVEVKGNIVLQLESDQHQEQGKFTLKWHINY